MHHIAEVAREELVESVNLAPFISLICDGSTDSAVLEQGELGVQGGGYYCCVAIVRERRLKRCGPIVGLIGASDWACRQI